MTRIKEEHKNTNKTCLHDLTSCNTERKWQEYNAIFARFLLNDVQQNTKWSQ